MCCLITSLNNIAPIYVVIVQQPSDTIWLRVMHSILLIVQQLR